MSSPDARTLLNIVSNCFAELRICGYELTEGKDLNWSPSLQMDEPASEEFEGVLSPSILVQVSEHVAMQVSVNLHWGAGDWMVDADIGQSDDRDEDSYRWLWQLPGVRSDSLDATLRAGPRDSRSHRGRQGAQASVNSALGGRGPGY